MKVVTYGGKEAGRSHD